MYSRTVEDAGPYNNSIFHLIFYMALCRGTFRARGELKTDPQKCRVMTHSFVILPSEATIRG